MLRLDLQFYAFFMTVMSGAVLGLLFDLLRATRAYYRPDRLVSALADLLFWVVATFALASGLFFANWAELRLYVLVGVGLGAATYLWLASPVALALIRLTLSLVSTLVRICVYLVQRLVVRPVRGLLLFVWGILGWITAWLARLGLGIGRFAHRVGYRTKVAAVRKYRCARLRYLLAIRRRRARSRSLESF